MVEKYHVGDRISIGSALATVKYAGTIHVWPETAAYGVEWDDPTRGKNDGCVDAVRYFTCLARGGSFVKASNSKIDARRLFSDAVEARYAGASNRDALRHTISFGSKTVEQVGFEKLNMITHDYQNLTLLLLDRQCILEAAVVPALHKLKNLDLSYNLLALWTDVSRILAQMPNLKSLNLNGNRISGGQLRNVPPKLQQLSLSDVRLKPQQLPLDECTHVTKLELAGNKWTDDDMDVWSPPSSVLTIDLSYNALTQVPAFIGGGKVREVLLHNNKIAEFDCLRVYPGVALLDVRFNLFSTLSAIDRVSVTFPNLIELKITHCSALDGLLVEEMTMLLLGRLDCRVLSGSVRGIAKLNGSAVLAEEVRNGELYVAGQIHAGRAVLENPVRLAYLRNKYSLHAQHNQARENNKTIALQFFNSCDPRVEVFARRFMRHNTVLRLKGVISKHILRPLLLFSVYCHPHDDEIVPKRYLDDDIAQLQSYGLVSNHRMYICYD
ncbi:L domain-like protein [Metschnikowia bicuspidata]|uniref:L domain-like protein n=1 Tax=Metschnikowia bicuspidata TaxID=27322 RepID=A0A4P9ZFD9_9ASCO|nr:L domain-like protein [Metschnikowia bicuspidata]